MVVEEILHDFIHIDEAWFDLTKARRNPRAVISVSGQHEGNIILHHHAKMGLQRSRFMFLVLLHNIVTAGNQMNWVQYIVIWDHVPFHLLLWSRIGLGLGLKKRVRVSSCVVFGVFSLCTSLSSTPITGK